MKIRINPNTINKILSFFLMIALLVVIIISGYLLFQNEAEKLKQQKQQTLQAIAYLKVNQIEGWNKDELEDAKIISSNAHLHLLIENFCNNITTSNTRKLKKHLNQIKEEHSYADLIVADLNGVIISSTDDQIIELEPTELKHPEIAINQRRSVSTYLFITAVNRQANISFISSIKSVDEAPVYAMVLRWNPESFLFPMITSWPLESQTAESLIFKVEQDSIIYLNTLRHIQNVPLELKLPTTRPDLPAVKALSGFSGITSGIDYRGQEVFAYVSDIKGTPWYLVSKIDTSEFLAELPKLTFFIISLTLLSILVAILSMVFIYNQRQKKIYQELYTKEKKLRQYQEKFKVIMDSLGDGVITVDLNFKVQFINCRAEELTGWKLMDAIGRDFHSIYNVKSEDTREVENNILKKIIKEGIVKELSNHTILIAKSGEEIPVMDTGAPMFDSDGKLIGIAIAFQDETERRQQERLLRESESKYREFFEEDLTGDYIVTAEGKIIDCNPAFVRMLGYNSKDEILDNEVIVFYAIPSEREQFLNLIKVKKTLQNYEINLKKKDGSIISCSVNAVGKFDVHGNLIQYSGYLYDITERKRAEEALLHSRDLLSYIVEHMRSAVAVHDRDLNYIYVSQRYLKEYNVQSKDVIGKHHYEVFPDLPQKWREVHQKALAGEVLSADDDPYHRSDGSVEWTRWECRPWYEQDGTVGGIILYTEVITDRKKAEEALRESEEKFRRISENINEVFWLRSLDNRTMLYINPVYEQLWGRSCQSLYENPSSFLDVIHPEDKEMVLRAFIDEVENEVPFDLEYRIVRPDEAVCWVWARSFPVTDESGTKVCVAGNAIDITERKQAETQIRKLSQAVEQSPVIVIITDIDGIIDYVNPKFTEITGYALNEAKGENINILKSGEHDQEYYRQLWQTIYSGKEWSGEFLNRKKNGELYWENAFISPIINSDGVVTNFVAIKEDITERKRIIEELGAAKEKAEESNRLKTAFLQNISHEIRTPMNGIIGFSQLLKGSTKDPEAASQYFDIIDKSGERLINLIDNLVDISKIEAGIVSIENEEFEINSILDELHQFFLWQSEEKGLRFELEKKPDPSDCRILSDKTKVYQILSNLINNAIKFTEEGSVSFGCSKENGVFTFFVKDSGVGIPKDKQEIIFERFIQADTSINRGYEGAGLGLSIVKAFMEELGGKIRLESESGKGSTFFFSIPCFRENLVVSPAMEENFLVEELPEKKDLKILIAEDDATSTLLVESILKPFSKQILKVKNGLEAIKICRENSDFDVILMDIKMPIVNGFSAIKEIRSFYKDVYIIAQTAYVFPGDKEKAFEFGCNDYITKPINRSELVKIIRKYLEKISLSKTLCKRQKS